MERVASGRSQKVLEELSAWPNLVASHTASSSSVIHWGKPVSGSLPTCMQTAGSSLRPPQLLLQRNEHQKSGEPASHPKTLCLNTEVLMWGNTAVPVESQAWARPTWLTRFLGERAWWEAGVCKSVLMGWFHCGTSLLWKGRATRGSMGQCSLQTPSYEDSKSMTEGGWQFPPWLQEDKWSDLQRTSVTNGAAVLPHTPEILGASK